MTDRQVMCGTDKKCSVIAVASQKGGAGKTTTVGNLRFGFRGIRQISISMQAWLFFSLFAEEGWRTSVKNVKMVMVHLCRNAAFPGRLSHDTFFDSVGLAVLSCRSR